MEPLGGLAMARSELQRFGCSTAVQTALSQPSAYPVSRTGGQVGRHSSRQSSPEPPLMPITQGAPKTRRLAASISTALATSNDSCTRGLPTRRSASARICGLRAAARNSWPSQPNLTSSHVIAALGGPPPCVTEERKCPWMYAASCKSRRYSFNSALEMSPTSSGSGRLRSPASRSSNTVSICSTTSMLRFMREA